MKSYKGIVTKINWETSDIFVFKTTFDELKDIKYEPGQFFMLSLDHITFDKQSNKQMKLPVKRAYSVCSTGTEKELEFCIKVEENGTLTPELAKLKKNDQINLAGPYGKFKLNNDIIESDSNIILLAVGSGITPILSMFRYLVNNQLKTNQITFVFGNKTIEDISYKEEIMTLAKKSKTKLIFSITREDKQVENHETFNERITVDKLKELNIDLDNSHFYMCGSLDFVKENKDGLLENNISKENIHFEIY